MGPTVTTQQDRRLESTPASDVFAALAMPALGVVAEGVVADSVLSALSSGPAMEAARAEHLHMAQQNEAFSNLSFDLSTCLAGMQAAA